MVVLAHTDSSEIHDTQATVEHFFVADVLELLSRRILFGVGGVDAVDTRTLEHHVSLNLNATERRACVGGEIWITGTGGEDADIAGLKCFDGLPLVVELTDGLHADGCHHLVFYTDGS